MPVTIRIPMGGGIGAVEHHSESPEAYFCHTAGLRVVACSNPIDGYFMIQQAVAHDDPVIFLEPKRRYWEKADLDPAMTPDALWCSRVVREGADATLIAYGPMVKVCMDAATVAAEDGRSLEVIDLRTLSPIDLPPLLASVQKTGHAVVVHEAQVFSGFGAELAAQVAERAFYHLEAPVLRVGGFDIPYPAAKLEEFHLPDVDRILDAVQRSLDF